MILTGILKCAHRLHSVTLAFLALILIQGCSFSGSDGDPLVVWDNGVKVIRYQEHLSPEFNPYRVQRGPSAQVYSESGDLHLERPSSTATLDEQGRLYVWDHGTKDIRVFEKDGSFAGTVGREGRGPGEFQGVQSLGAMDNDLHAFDPRRMRIIIHGLNGSFQREIESDYLRELWSVVPYSPGDSVAYVGFRSFRSALLGGDDTYRYQVVLLGESARPERSLVDSSDVRSTRPPEAVGNPIESRFALFAMRPDSPAAWTFGPHYSVDCYDPITGDRWRIKSPGRKRPVTADLKSTYMARYEGTADEERVRRTAEWPEYLPEIGSLTWDDEGRLWVLAFEPSLAESEHFLFDVFDREGRLLFSQELPPAYPILLESGVLYVREELEDGSQTIQQYLLIEQ